MQGDSRRESVKDLRHDHLTGKTCGMTTWQDYGFAVHGSSMVIGMWTADYLSVGCSSCGGALQVLAVLLVKIHQLVLEFSCLLFEVWDLKVNIACQRLSSLPKERTCKSDMVLYSMHWSARSF